MVASVPDHLPALPAQPKRWDVLAHLAARLDARRYLEIGVDRGETMRRVPCAERWGVDPSPTIEAITASDVFVPKTSRAFLDWLECTAFPPRFDLVFLDGWHEAELVYEEATRLLPYLTPNAAVVLHDASPLTEAMQAPEPYGVWCGDVWKAVVRLRRDFRFAVRTIDHDLGIAIALPTGRQTDMPTAESWGTIKATLAWDYLQENRADVLGILEPADLDAWLTAEGRP